MDVSIDEAFLKFHCHFVFSGLGGGLLPWTLQQCVVCHVPSAAGTDPLQFRRQVHQSLGHEQAHLSPHPPT